MAVPSSKQNSFFNKYISQSKLEIALNLVLDYIRFEKKEFLKARYIAAHYGLKDNHSMLTAIGWALSILESKGWLIKYNKKTWLVTRELFELITKKRTYRYEELRNVSINKLNEEEFDFVIHQILMARTRDRHDDSTPENKYD